MMMMMTWTQRNFLFSELVYFICFRSQTSSEAGSIELNEVQEVRNQLHHLLTLSDGTIPGYSDFYKWNDGLNLSPSRVCGYVTSALFWFFWNNKGTEAEIQLPLKRSSRFQRLFPNPSWLVWGRASRHQKLAPTFPGIDSCLMVTKRDFLEMEASLWLNGKSQNVAEGWLST